MNTTEKGDLTEYTVISKLLSLGVDVSKPVGNGLPYDLILDVNNKLIKVQVKTGRIINNCVRFNTRVTKQNTTKTYSGNYIGKIDYFISWCPENNEFYMVDISKAKKVEQVLRIVDTGSGQNKNIVWAKDFLLDSVLKHI